MTRDTPCEKFNGWEDPDDVTVIFPNDPCMDCRYERRDHDLAARVRAEQAEDAKSWRRVAEGLQAQGTEQAQRIENLIAERVRRYHEWRSAEARIVALEGALRKHGYHDDSCPAWANHRWRDIDCGLCTCGLGALLTPAPKEPT